MNEKIIIAESWTKADKLIEELNKLIEFVYTQRKIRKGLFGTGKKGALLFAMAHVGNFLTDMGNKLMVAKAKDLENEQIASILTNTFNEELDHMRELKKLFISAT